MFKKILIADRGEIALRIIRACKELGIQTVAVHSTADEHSLHIRFADEDVRIGPAPSGLSYRNVPSIISAAEITDVDAIHPGYGPLAENAFFAEVCESCGITFIGPSPETIRRMGDKSAARRSMVEADVPVIPGSESPLESFEMAREIADAIGYPVIFKAVAGGGGRGMRVVRTPDELQQGWQMAKAEAGAAFTSSELYIERYIERPRHVEVQILGDHLGNIIQLGERDCSIQRRHQKLVEESPSPGVDQALRDRLGAAAVRGAKAVGYHSAGTVEFLIDPSGAFMFMEMNTRIQVEHPVTEMVTGIDLVKAQIRLASGDPLWMEQGDVYLRGHAIECRINAEDCSRGFTPTPGTLTSFHIPGGPGVRVDTHVYSSYRIPPHYDSLLAKVIVHGSTREEAIMKMDRALEEFIIEGNGIQSTIPFHRAVVRDPKFKSGRVDTTYIDGFHMPDDHGE